MTQPRTTLSKTETWSLLALSAACLAILGQTLQSDGAPLVAAIAFSGLAFALTYSLIRWLGAVFMKAGFKGKDMSKVKKIEIPETMGAVCAVVYLLVIIIFIPFQFYKDIVAATSGGGNRDYVVEVKTVDIGRFLHKFPHSKLASYLSAVLSLESVVILGLGDDLFDIRWRHKVLIPAFASIPMLVVYFVDFGVTSIVVPIPFRPYLGDIVDLGWLYYAYMFAMSIFAPNSINILAGINGIEVGQSIVIALLILLNDTLYLLPLSSQQAPAPPHPATDVHLASVYMLLPFLGVSLALLTQNWYPSRVFVGDTYCYFAGMVFAVVAINGHFSKTLLLLLIPQIFNFAYSVPQLFGLVPCPRHRLPHFNARTGLLEPSWADFTNGASTASTLSGSPPLSPTTNGRLSSPTTIDGPASPMSASNGSLFNSTIPHTRKPSQPTSSSVTVPNGTLSLTIPTSVGLPKHRPTILKRPLSPLIQSLLKLLHNLHLLHIETDPTTSAVLRCTNFTILNLWLVWFGPRREDRLCVDILAAQAVLGVLGLFVRHRLALWIFTADNW